MPKLLRLFMKPHYHGKTLSLTVQGACVYVCMSVQQAGAAPNLLPRLQTMTGHECNTEEIGE